uniref:Uncharacterized protein n=1 Tax=Aegilops tauschii TaxID=37682 RepID=M8AS72_AEGTA
MRITQVKPMGTRASTPVHTVGSETDHPSSRATRLVNKPTKGATRRHDRSSPAAEEATCVLIPVSLSPYMAGDCGHLGPSRKRAPVDADRLSDLPDCLLEDILSRLGSLQAVRTSALSRRWRHVWRSVRCVDIDQREFPGSGTPGSRQYQRFEDFADTMLPLPPGAARPPLDTFRLHFADAMNRVAMNTTSFGRWIRRGFMRRPATVDLQCDYVNGCILWPPCHEIGGQLPVLEDLHLDNCCYYGVLTIASPTLKSLAVTSNSVSYSTDTVAIAAPRLASLRLVLPFGRDGRTSVVTKAPGNEALPSLVEASICLNDLDQRAYKAKLPFLRSLCSFLGRLTNVTKLELSGFTTTALLDHESQDFPVLENLRTLLLDGCDIGAIDLQVLMKILENAPNLEKLRLHRCKFLGRPKRSKGKAGPKRTCPNQCVSTLVRHKKLNSIEIKYQPQDEAHLKEFFGKYVNETPKEMQLWRVARNLSISRANTRGGDQVSTAAHVTPVQESTLYLRRTIPRDPAVANHRSDST